MIGWDESVGGLVPTVDFEYPEDGDHEPTVVRDQWRDEPLSAKCQRRFARVPSGELMTMPLLDKRLDVLQYALREAVEAMDVPTIWKLAEKARATAERIATERLAEATPSTREVIGDILVLDDADRGKVILHFPTPISQRERRWLQICGFISGGDGMTYWRRRTFRRGENMALERARHCAQRIMEERETLAAATQPAAAKAMVPASNEEAW
jgi:hypothetical protein